MEFFDVKHSEGVTTITMSRGKVNAIDLPFLLELQTILGQLKSRPDTHAVLLAGKPHYFSAGLDLVELYRYDEGQLAQFWELFLRIMVDLVAFPKPLVAAITGHCPAGGTILALGADSRIMADDPKYLIGLNEVKVGIIIPSPIFDLYSFWLGRSTAYQSLLTGRLFNPQQALQVGLVDSICPLDQVDTRALSTVQDILSNSYEVVLQTKRILRGDLIKCVNQDYGKEVADRVKAWMDPANRAFLKGFIAKFTKGS